MVTYKIVLEGHGPAELNQKPETPAPQVGQSIFAELQPNSNPSFPPKVKKVQQGGFGGGRGRSPEETKSIVRQHSQEMALRALTLAHAMGISLKVNDDDSFFVQVEKVTDWFEKDAA